MTRLRQLVFRHRHMAMLALVLAFALRALIPQGMMTAPDGAGAITVLLCDGSGAAAQMAIPIGEKSGKAHADHACPFAVLAQTGAADAPGGWTIAPHVQPGVLPQRTPESLGNSKTHHAHPPARAPPVAV